MVCATIAKQTHSDVDRDLNTFWTFYNMFVIFPVKWLRFWHVLGCGVYNSSFWCVRDDDEIALMTRKHTALITGAPVSQPFSHESNKLYKRISTIWYLVQSLGAASPGSKAHIVFSVRAISIPTPRCTTALSLAPQNKTSRRKHTSLQVDEFIAGTGTSSDVLLSVAAVVIVSILVTTNHDKLTRINTCCVRAVVVGVWKAWAIPCLGYRSACARCVCFYSNFRIVHSGQTPQNLASKTAPVSQ